MEGARRRDERYHHIECAYMTTSDSTVKAVAHMHVKSTQISNLWRVRGTSNSLKGGNLS